MGALEAVAIICFVILVVIVVMIKEQRLSDPDRLDTIYSNQMQDVCLLRNGPVSAALFRQSGNLYRDLGLFDDWKSAMHEIETSFRRAKIDAVYVVKNTPDHFEVFRLHHSHRGKAEGKKLGGAVIASET
ncbi:hypothetical protein [Rhodovulum adriaticum]|uniref:hypothetical protein n=1 Tax=Rhodovulum adriaticum TaxID=35804 RepID=UPI001050B8ED|nr:hypothetical protein [Rhodovulum adriaticum]MBK1636737.1 hypothetical protein [Rhodovulum adriaticum]